MYTYVIKAELHMVINAFLCFAELIRYMHMILR